MHIKSSHEISECGNFMAFLFWKRRKLCTTESVDKSERVYERKRGCGRAGSARQVGKGEFFRFSYKKFDRAPVVYDRIHNVASSVFSVTSPRERLIVKVGYNQFTRAEIKNILVLGVVFEQRKGSSVKVENIVGLADLTGRDRIVAAIKKKEEKKRGV